MIINTNDIKSSCRAMLINSLSSSTPEPEPEPIEPADWSWPEDWLELTEPSSNEIKVLVGSNSKNRTTIEDYCYTIQSVLFLEGIKDSGVKICNIDWGDGLSTDVLSFTSSSEENTIISYNGNTHYIKHKYSQNSGHILNDGREQWLVTIKMSSSQTNYFLTSSYYSELKSEVSAMALKMSSNTYFSKLTGITFKNNNLLEYIKVSSLRTNCFEYCAKLKKIEFSRIITEIPSYCFRYCSSLEKINFNNIGIVQSGAFDYCTSLIFAKFKTTFNSCFSSTQLSKFSYNSSSSDNGINIVLYPKSD